MKWMSVIIDTEDYTRENLTAVGFSIPFFSLQEKRDTNV